MSKFSDKGFTLIEMLIVIGILAVMAVTLLFTLNPADAQKGSRDSERLRDATALQAIINSYFDEGNSASVCLTGATGCTSNPTGKACDNNWLQINVCKYAGNIPADPMDGQANVPIVIQTGITFTSSSYIVKINPADYSKYEIDVRQEKVENRPKMLNDGGNDGDWYELGTDLTTL